MKEPKRTVLWSATGQQANNTSIELTDSIDNYDELWFYGSGTRTYTPCVITEYPVIPGVVNLGGPFFVGKWGSTDTYLLCNGTQIFLSGNSGYVASSFFFGKNNNSTAWAASLVNNRANDIRPFKIIGINYKDDRDRTVVWSSTGENLFNKDITLSETLNHFDNFILYSSGYETGTNGCYHAGKNIYQVQDASKVINAGSWAYTPWKEAQKHNLLIGEELLLNGNSGHIRSGFYWGMGNQTTAYAAGRWNENYAMSALQPYKIVAYNRHPTYNFYALPSEGGSVASNIPSGYSGDIATITAIPESDVWRQSALNITGAELTGNDFMFGNSNVSAQAEFEHSRDLTLVNSEHATLSADKMSGFSGDVVTVDATTDEGWYFTGLNVTGATATGNQFMFVGENVTAEGLYTDEGYPITYLSDEHVSLTGDQIYIPGSEGITLDSGYDTYYRISGYDITGGSIVDGKLVATGPCIIKAVEKINYFTATGNFEKGSNVTCNGGNASPGGTKYVNVPAKYALHVNHTGDISTNWYSTSNRWKPSNASAYSIKINSKMSFRIRGVSYYDARGYVTATTLVGSTQNQNQTWSQNNNSIYLSYNKTITTTTQNVNYGVSAKLGAQHHSTDMGGYVTAYADYFASGTTGTWTATGIAP